MHRSVTVWFPDTVQRLAETEQEKEERLEEARKKAFAEKRKAHYNEFSTVKMGGLLGQTFDDDEDEDEDEDIEIVEGEGKVEAVEPKEGSGWTIVTSSSGDQYYFHAESGESTWELPEDAK